MSSDDKRIKWRGDIVGDFQPLTRVYERYRETDRQTDDRQTDGRTTTYSEPEREFTFAKMGDIE